MQDLNVDIVSRLSHLVQLLNDARNGYTLAAEKEEHADLKTMYQHFGNERDAYLQELKQVIKERGGDIAGIFAPAEKPASSWMKVGAAAEGDHKDIVAACTKAENSVINDYRVILGDDALDDNIKIILERQLNGMDYAVRKISNHLTPTL